MGQQYNQHNPNYQGNRNQGSYNSNNQQQYNQNQQQNNPNKGKDNRKETKLVVNTDVVSSDPLNNNHLMSTEDTIFYKYVGETITLNLHWKGNPFHSVKNDPLKLLIPLFNNNSLILDNSSEKQLLDKCKNYVRSLSDKFQPFKEHVDLNFKLKIGKQTIGIGNNPDSLDSYRMYVPQLGPYCYLDIYESLRVGDLGRDKTRFLHSYLFNKEAPVRRWYSVVTVTPSLVQKIKAPKLSRLFSQKIARQYLIKKSVEAMSIASEPLDILFEQKEDFQIRIGDYITNLDIEGLDKTDRLLIVGKFKSSFTRWLVVDSRNQNEPNIEDFVMVLDSGLGKNSLSREYNAMYAGTATKNLMQEIISKLSSYSEDLQRAFPDLQKIRYVERTDNELTPTAYKERTDNKMSIQSGSLIYFTNNLVDNSDTEYTTKNKWFVVVDKSAGSNFIRWVLYPYPEYTINKSNKNVKSRQIGYIDARLHPISKPLESFIDINVIKNAPREIFELAKNKTKDTYADGTTKMIKKGDIIVIDNKPLFVINKKLNGDKVSWTLIPLISFTNPSVINQKPSRTDFDYSQGSDPSQGYITLQKPLHGKENLEFLTQYKVADSQLSQILGKYAADYYMTYDEHGVPRRQKEGNPLLVGEPSLSRIPENVSLKLLPTDIKPAVIPTHTDVKSSELIERLIADGKLKTGDVIQMKNPHSKEEYYAVFFTWSPENPSSIYIVPTKNYKGLSAEDGEEPIESFIKVVVPKQSFQEGIKDGTYKSFNLIFDRDILSNYMSDEVDAENTGGINGTDNPRTPDIDDHSYSL